MNLANQLPHAILGKSSLAECSLEELQQLANQYPWFGPAQLLLTKKMLVTEDAAVDKQLQKTSLFFQNPFWLDQLLLEEGKQQSSDDSALTSIESKPQPFISETMISAEAEQPFTHEDVVTQPNPVTSAKEADVEIITELELSELQEQNLQAELEQPFTSEEMVIQSEDEAAYNDTGEYDTTGEGPLHQPELAIKMPGLKIEPINPSTAELTFEPYHTVDYFASQGIRMKEDTKQRDKFSEHLKSFTEWLKTMKKVPASEIIASLPNQEEKKVEQMAEQSITDREVVTEAMAEVWEKQGDWVRATQTYQKLSLLDPAKSAYFAAKIEQLKHL